MTHVADHVFPAPTLRRCAPRARPRAPRPLRIDCRDQRWPAIAAALSALRAAKRRSVRIVDAECGAGRILLCAVRYARALGFTSIEGRGIDDAPALVRRAQAAAGDLHAPAIGLTFETGEMAVALQDESDFPADIVVWHGGGRQDRAVVRALAAAGHTLIADPTTGGCAQ